MSEAVLSPPTDQRTHILNGGLPNGNYMPVERGQTTETDFCEDENQNHYPSPNFLIRLQDVKRTYSTCTLLLHKSQEISQSINCYPHLGIQLDESVACKTDGSLKFDIFDIHCQNLGEFIKANKMSKSLNWADRVQLIKKLAESIQHYHGFDKQHGNLSVECISISCDPSKRPFIWSSSEPGCKGSSSDVQSLGKIAYYILTDGEKYTGSINQEKISKCYRLDFTKKLADVMSLEAVETAHDLLECTICGKVEINDISNHPFFWSDSQKATFVSDLFDSLGTNMGALKEVEESLKEKVFGKDWIKKLRISPEEKYALPKTDEKGNVNMDIFINKAQGCSVKVRQYDIKSSKLQEIRVVGMTEKKWKRFKKSGLKVDDFATLIEENQWLGDHTQCVMLQNVVFRKVEEKPPYDGSSLYDLMRFLRNRKVHCYECPKGSSNGNQELEYYKHLGGYWNFYSARFPKLLVLLYQHVDQFPHYEGNAVKVEW